MRSDIAQLHPSEMVYGRAVEDFWSYRREGTHLDRHDPALAAPQPCAVPAVHNGAP